MHCHIEIQHKIGATTKKIFMFVLITGVISQSQYNQSSNIQLLTIHLINTKLYETRTPSAVA